MTRHKHTLCLATARDSIEHSAGKCSPHSPYGCCWPPPGHSARMDRLERLHPELWQELEGVKDAGEWLDRFGENMRKMIDESEAESTG